MRQLTTLLLSLLALTAGAEQTDVVVGGGTPSGVAAAVAAARSGAKVVLIEESRHVGGILSGGLTNTDIRKTDASSTLLYEVMSSKAGDGVFATGNDQAFTLRCRPTGATATNAQLFGAWSSP